MMIERYGAGHCPVCNKWLVEENVASIALMEWVPEMGANVLAGMVCPEHLARIAEAMEA
jgi:hypothetical protein